MKMNLRTLVLAPVALAVVAFTAQSAMAAATVKVPFSFTVNGKQCPAGAYSVERIPALHIVRLHGVDNTKSFNWILEPSDTTASNDRVVLKFDDSDSNHTLKFVQFGSESTSEIDRMGKHSHSNAAPTGQGK